MSEKGDSLTQFDLGPWAPVSHGGMKAQWRRIFVGPLPRERILSAGCGENVEEKWNNGGERLIEPCED